jgi:hypothetical protein
MKLGGVDVDQFFDHLVMYRPGKPVLPLADCHDAFRGDLYLSGHYEKSDLEPFLESLKATAELIVHPAYANPTK